MILALSLFSALAFAQEPAPQSYGVTLTCSARLPTGVVGCFAERTMFVLGDFEVAVGVDVQATFSDFAQGHIAPYAIVAYYADGWSVWGEFRLPELYGLHPLGDPDWARVGFSMRF